MENNQWGVRKRKRKINRKFKGINKRNRKNEQENKEKCSYKGNQDKYNLMAETIDQTRGGSYREKFFVMMYIAWVPLDGVREPYGWDGI